MNMIGVFREVPWWLTWVVLPTAGAIAHNAWSRYRRRLVMLRWSVQYQPMAFATEDFGWGKVEILYNGAPTRNLHIANIQIQNASSKDLAQLRVDVVCNFGTSVLRSAGQVRGSLEPFPFALDYQQVLGRAGRAQLAPSELEYWKVRSPFFIPVLNREQVADIRLLASRDDHQVPNIGVAIDHLGIRLSQQVPTQLVLGVRLGQALIVGILSGFLLIAAAELLGATSWLIAALAWAVGAVAQHLGALVVRAGRQLLKIID